MIVKIIYPQRLPNLKLTRAHLKTISVISENLEKMKAGARFKVIYPIYPISKAQTKCQEGQLIAKE